MVKRCAWGTCRNDSRFQHLQVRNINGDPIKFFRFPPPKRWKEAAEMRKRWIIACHRGDTFTCKKGSYICSLHFVGENGPTEEHPDPISAISSKDKVCSAYYGSIMVISERVVWCYLKYITCNIHIFRLRSYIVNESVR